MPRGGNATQLMDQWATCMRANGDPDQTDPTIDQYGVINITIPQGVTDASISSEAHGSSGPCSQYIAAIVPLVIGMAFYPYKLDAVLFVLLQV